MRLAGTYAQAGLLALAGITCVAVAIASQHEAVQVPLAVPTPTLQVTAVPAPPVPVPTVLTLPASMPTSLAIPAIHVRAALLHVGQAADGTLAVPPPGPHYDQPAWYRYSPTPGARGPSVIVGHIDSKSGGPSVFFRLGELKRSDPIRVTRDDGSVAVFAVDDVRRFHKADFPSRLVYGNTDHAALRLITCGGPFDRTTGHYVDNIIVTATLLRSA
jgi:sortase (surface protein transpeptidase)